MKFVCSTLDLCEAVTNVSRAVSSKSSLPALEGILLASNQTQIILSGYDLEIAIKTTIHASVATEGCVVLNARLFGEILKKVSGDKITVSVDEKLNATISSGDSQFSIMAIDANDYPELPVLSEQKSISFDSDLLKSMVSQTIFAVSTSEIRPVHTGILFEIENNNLKLVAVDGYRLAIRNEKIGNSENTRFIVPAKALSEILKLVDEQTSQIAFNVGSRHISFEVGNFFVISRLLDGEFLDYKSAVPAGAQITVLAKAREMINAVDRISLLITDRVKSPVRCTFEDGKAFVRCTTAMGKASDVVSVETSGDPIEIGFNNKYFIDALRAVDCDVVKIEMNGPTSPMKIVPIEGDSFLFLVVPVRLKSE